MKNKILLGVLGLVALAGFAGCGAQDEAEGEIILGQAEQAIYLPFGYGTEGNQSACDSSWSGGVCDAPDFRKIALAVMTNSCDGDFDGFMIRAADRWRNFMLGVGWDVQWKENDYPNMSGNYISVSMGCNGSTSGGAYASTGVNVTPAIIPVFGSYECHDATPGDFCQFQKARINIFYKLIRNHPAWSAAPANKKDNFAVNIIQHELYHASGLGHDLSASPGSRLMSSAPPATGSTANVWTLKFSPTNAQRDQLACYNPSSSTQPADVSACPL